MKKIGILTLFDPINYGACLQTYALRAFLEQCGFDAQVIDYRPQSGNVDKRTSFQKMRSYIWKNTLYKLLCDKKRIELTEQFKKDNIQYSGDIFYSIGEMDSSCNYDALIVGSDQVWNPQFSGNDKAWFLEFGTASSSSCRSGFPDSKRAMGKNWRFSTEEKVYTVLLYARRRYCRIGNIQGG